jgi:hypothetical protein
MTANRCLKDGDGNTWTISTAIIARGAHDERQKPSNYTSLTMPQYTVRESEPRSPEIRNPKAEIRRKSEIRNPKAGIAKRSDIGFALNAEATGASASRSDRTE